MRFIWLIITGTLLSSCGPSSEIEVIDIGELLPESTYQDSSQTSEQIEETTDSLLLTLINIFGLEGLNVLDNNNQTFLPDRIRHMQRMEKTFELNGTNFSFVAWQYEDTVLPSNALYNWMDCFGPECKEITWSSTDNISKTESIRILKGQNHLVYLTSRERTDFKALDTWLNELFPEEEWRTEIVQQKGREVKWVF
jgi:hypothetical protein